ncbi:phosphomannomutase/phosphoglucomutase [Acetobacteraceae bacterium]|nr:phosphomannomutase/phosphoglucomutase [Acetobacteraceae bacterium]
MSGNTIFSHHFNPNILRAYDIRGVIGEELNPVDAYAVGCAFAEKVHLSGGKKIVVGYDGRLSSTELEKNLVSGIVDAGLDVLRIGLGPTPMVYFAAAESDVDASIMITGSHNPGTYNGFKFTLNGKPFYGDSIQDLAKLVKDGIDLTAKKSGNIENKSFNALYVKRIAKDYQGKKPLKVVWDSGNSVAGPVLQALTEILPGEHTILFPEVDGHFPNHHPDPTVEKNLAFLKEAVISSGADIGVAFDGDADRVGVIDNLGNVMWGDQILAFLAADILKTSPGATIIGEVKCSQNTYDAIAAAGGTPLMWKCGHSFIKAKMAEVNALLAGEMSGHLFFADKWYGFDDGIYSAVRIIDLLSRHEKPLSELRSEMPETFSTPEIRLHISDERKFTVIKELSQILEKEGQKFCDIDGIRASFPEGWWLLRCSNTEPAIIARVESFSLEGKEKLKKDMENQLKKVHFPEESLKILETV